jgi:hypothetical protein
VFRERYLGGVQDTREIAFGRVAPDASVEEVVVITDLCCGPSSRAEVLDAERVLAVWAPSFATETINTAESKLVA